jgi:hypothetical protein
MRRILLVVGALLALLLVILALVPALFGGRIAARVKTEVNRSVNARVDWREAHLGVFRHFPNVTLQLDELSTVGTGKFAADTLAAVRELRLVLDLASVVRNALGGGPVVVRAVELDQPRLSLIALEDGTANWNITKPDSGGPRAASGRPVAVSLRRFAIDRGRVTFDNRAARLKASLAGFDQTLAGDFSRDQANVETKARVDSTTVEFAGIRYLNGVRVDLDITAAADLARKSYALREGNLRLNDLSLALTGTAASVGDRLALDLAFKAPDTKFRHILSLVPAVYAKDFGSVQAAGSFAVTGQVKGQYGKDAFPAFQLNARVDSGAFKYPDRPLPARDLFLALAVSNPGGSVDSTTVNLSRFHALLGRNPIDAGLVLRTPISDPDVDARFTGTIDLADLRRTVKLEKVQQLGGVVSADAAVHTRRSWVDRGQYDKIAARGTIDVRDFAVTSAALPRPLTIRQASLALAPRRAELRSFSGTVGSSDLAASGWLDNLVGYVMQDQELRGGASVASNRFDLNEWRSDTGKLNVIPVPPKLDLALDAKVKQLLYEKITMTDAVGRLRVKDQRVTLENFQVNALGGQMAFDGYYETTNLAKPTFDLGLKIRQLDVPSAFQAFNTVQALAPVAKYATGTFSTEMRLTGPLQQNMMPVFPELRGGGTLQTAQIQIKDFPALEKAAQVTKLAILNDPMLRNIRSRFAIKDGRLAFEPFTVPLGPTSMTIAGSSGLNQSLDFDLGLRVPRSLFGGNVNQALSGLQSKASSLGIDLANAAEIPLGIRIGGTVTNPTVTTDLSASAGNAAASAGEAVKGAATQKVAATVDSAKLRASAAAQKLVADAESRAAGIRAQARALADTVKKQGYLQADSLAAKGGNPLAKVAANAAADRLRQETDSKAARIVQEADARADALVAEARRQAAGKP